MKSDLSIRIRETEGKSFGSLILRLADRKSMMLGEWTGENAKTYGLAKKDQTNFIVTSGISDWAIKFKTGCRSEYVVIDIKGK